MGNNQVVGEYVSEEELQEIEQKDFLNTVKYKFNKVSFTIRKEEDYLRGYYYNIKKHIGECINIKSYTKLNILNRFLDYDTYELVRDTGFKGRAYRIAMINYIYKWYSNMKI